MFQIAIVDDNAFNLEMICAMIRNYICENTTTPMNLTVFNSPLELMDSVETGVEYNAFFLDIVMPGMTGIDVARELRAMGISVPIIFITAEKEYALEAFHVGATQYLVTGFSYKELKATIEKAMEIVSKERRRHIVLCTRKGYRHIFCRNIMYSVTNRNYQDIVLDSGEVLEVRLSHRVIAETLTESVNFIRVGSSFVINMFFVTGLDGSNITMLDSFTIPMPRRQAKRIEEACTEFFDSLGRNRRDFEIL